MADKKADPLVDDLRRSLEHIMVPEIASLQGEIKNLHALIDQVENVSLPLPDDLDRTKKKIEKLKNQTSVIENHVEKIQANLTETDKVIELVKLGLRPALQQEVAKSPTIYGKIISPAISKAITDQIKNSRTEMIEALHPIIGQTIQSAIAEAFNDLRRRIDNSMSSSMNLGKFFNGLKSRVRGVSRSDQIIRDSLNYKVTQVFLIHRATGLLLDHVSSSEEKEDLDIIGSLLTAIRDFAHDTFGEQDSELEEIQFGNAHILLKSGTQAYVASVIEGVQPSGYSTFMQSVVYKLNQGYMTELSQYAGEMTDLPDFKSELIPLLDPSPEELAQNVTPETLSQGQKVGLWIGLVGLLLLMGFLVFACNFSLRLIPVAFPPATPSVTLTVIPTSTRMPTVTQTSTPIPTMTMTVTMTVEPTNTPVVLPTGTIEPVMGVTTGNVYSRLEPSARSNVNPLVVMINTPIEILAVQGKWAKISWQSDFGYQEGWIPLQFVGVPQGLPEYLVTPLPVD
jgi:hypothetical protein